MEAGVPEIAVTLYGHDKNTLQEQADRVLEELWTRTERPSNADELKRYVGTCAIDMSEYHPVMRDRHQYIPEWRGKLPYPVHAPTVVVWITLVAPTDKTPPKIAGIARYALGLW